MESAQLSELPPAPAIAERPAFPTSFSDFLAPLSEAEFFEAVGRHPLVARQDHLAEAFTMKDALAQIQCLDFAKDGGRSAFQLIKPGDAIPDMLLANKVDSPVDQWLPKFLKQGWTLMMEDVTRGSLPLHQLAAAIAQNLHSRAWINVYFTPAGQQGFRCHADRSHVFVCQQSGRKRWRIYEPKPDGKYNVGDDPGELVLDQVLEPGDTLFIPEEFPHYAVSEEGEDSLHITIAFISRKLWLKEQFKARFDRWNQDLLADRLLGEDAFGSGSIGELLETGQGFIQWLEQDLQALGIAPPDPIAVPASRDVDDVRRDLRSMNGESVFQLTGDIHRLPLREPFQTALAGKQSFQIGDLDLDGDKARHLTHVLVSAGLAELG